MFADFSFSDVLGLIGSLVICSAYLAVSLGRINAERLPYQLINISGAVLLLISLYYRPNLGAITIEVLWITIALIAIASSKERSTIIPFNRPQNLMSGDRNTICKHHRAVRVRVRVRVRRRAAME